MIRPIQKIATVFPRAKAPSNADRGPQVKGLEVPVPSSRASMLSANSPETPDRGTVGVIRRLSQTYGVAVAERKILVFQFHLRLHTVDPDYKSSLFPEIVYAFRS